MQTRSVAMALIGVAAIAALALIIRNLGGFSTRAEPTVLERTVARAARRLAVPRAARTASNPIAFSEEVWANGRAHFADHCASCHGNDGRGNTEIGRNLYPRAPDMRLPATQNLSDGELYWIIENGVRLTGMPAWGDGSGDDRDTWMLVHVIRRLGDLTDAHLAEMQSLNPRSPAEFAEEQDDRDFLEGKMPDKKPSTPSLHLHKD
jgi:mono/diheme cytochrome c family protein